MGVFVKLVSFLVVCIVVYIGIVIHNFKRDILSDEPLRKIENKWWGPGNPEAEDVSIRPFSINISDQVLEDLRIRLDKVSLFPPLEGLEHQYGVNTNLLKEILEFWKTKYNWRKREARLNSFPQFKTKIQGLDIYYAHVKPKKIKGIRILPMIVLHGWPGSTQEMFNIVRLLTTPRKDKDFVFEVISPSLPGFSFSEGPAKVGLGIGDVANIMKNLMLRLGFEKFYVHGGDVGGLTVSNMAALFPQHVIGYHSNLCYDLSYRGMLKLFVLGSIYPPAVVEKQYEHRMYPLYKWLMFVVEESAYFHFHATKPDTIGIALGDSPAGMAAYFIEKYFIGANRNFKNKAHGGLIDKYKYEDLLDSIMIFWVTKSITTSMRYYSEYFHLQTFQRGIERIPVEVPSACAILENEIIYIPVSILRDKYRNLVHAVHYDDVGHFPALEVPELLVNDIFLGIEKMQKLR